MSIRADSIDFAYESQYPVLKNASFSAKQGELVGFFGPNGGGKTTLMMLLLGLLQPSKGKIEILGKSPSEVSNQIGYVPQIKRFDRQFPITVLEVVLHGCFAKYKGFGNFSKEAKEKSLETLIQVGLADKAYRPFSTLSGGQVQRALLARALVLDPQILILDEATVGIDPAALEEIWRLINSLKRSMTILMVTHELQTTAKEMDLLLCVNQQVMAYTPQEVCHHFSMGLYHPPKKGKADD